MSGVYHSSSTNSTTFTTCCGVAVHDEVNCPSCGEEVNPQGSDARFRSAMRQEGMPRPLTREEMKIKREAEILNDI